MQPIDYNLQACHNNVHHGTMCAMLWSRHRTRCDIKYACRWWNWPISGHNVKASICWMGPSQTTILNQVRMSLVEQAHHRTQCDITTHGCCPLNRSIPEHNVTSQHTGVARWTGPSQTTILHQVCMSLVEQAHPRTQCDITTHGCCPLNRPIPEHNVTSQHTGVARWTGPSQNTMRHGQHTVLSVEQAHHRTQCDITTHGCCPLNRPISEHNVASQHTGVARWTGPSQNTMWHHNTQVLPVEQAHHRTQCDTDNTRVLPVEQAHPRTQRDITTHGCCPLNRPITEHNATRTTHGCCPLNRPIT